MPIDEQTIAELRAIPQKIEAIIRLYADSYRMMGRMGDGRVHASDVAVDLEINVLKQVLAALIPGAKHVD